MWLLGGKDAGGVKNDIWSSVDGVNWNLETASAAWPAREAHTATVYNNKIWLMGGADDSMSALGDIWSSVDGVNWNLETASAAWPARSYYTTVVFDGKLWVLGGGGDFFSPAMNDVWWTTDGINWEVAVNNAPWVPRLQHTSVVHNGKMWVLGGFDMSANPDSYNDVWSSVDGVNWNLETASAAWSIREEHTSVVAMGKIWVMGGFDMGYKNDIWSSVDGVNWEHVNLSPPWSLRAQHNSVVFNDKIWIVGGSTMGGTLTNDVWYSRIGPISYYKNPSVANGSALVNNTEDPVYNFLPVISQSYNERNNFTNNQGAIGTDESGKWDFSLFASASSAANNYCFRAVRADGSQLHEYTVIPNIQVSQ
jgi:leucine-zipper-like transcriptional regulator 1